MRRPKNFRGWRQAAFAKASLILTPGVLELGLVRRQGSAGFGAIPLDTQLCVYVELYLGRIYELTGPRSQDMHGVAREFSDALNREVTYSDIPPRIGNGS